MAERVFNIILKIAKNFGYIGFGCIITGFIEVGVFDAMILGLILSVLIIVLSYIAIGQMERNEKWIGRKFISMVLKKPIKSSNAEEFDDILNRLSEEIWELCATDENKIQGL